MSVCNCKKPDAIRLSDEEWEDEERNKFNMIRCCMCGGKWGSINLETNNISPFYGEKNKAKPTRYISRTDRGFAPKVGFDLKVLFLTLKSCF